jgi:hypothetical protein
LPGQKTAFRTLGVLQKQKSAVENKTNRATLNPIVEFDLKFLPVPVTACTQHFHIELSGNLH